MSVNKGMRLFVRYGRKQRVLFTAATYCMGLLDAALFRLVVCWWGGGWDQN